jgi:hypothetical protein
MSLRPTVSIPSLVPSAAAAVASLIASLQAGWNSASADVFDSRFAADIIWGSPYGQAIAGFQQLNDIHRSIMATGKLPASRYEVVKVLAPAVGVVITHVSRRTFAKEQGEVEAKAKAKEQEEVEGKEQEEVDGKEQEEVEGKEQEEVEKEQDGIEGKEREVVEGKEQREVERNGSVHSEGGFSEMAMYVLVEREGKWWVAGGQNTVVGKQPKRV